MDDDHGRSHRKRSVEPSRSTRRSADGAPRPTYCGGHSTRKHPSPALELTLHKTVNVRWLKMLMSTSAVNSVRHVSPVAEFEADPRRCRQETAITTVISSLTPRRCGIDPMMGHQLHRAPAIEMHGEVCDSAELRRRRTSSTARLVPSPKWGMAIRTLTRRHRTKRPLSTRALSPRVGHGVP